MHVDSVIIKMVGCTVWELHTQKQCTLKEASSLPYYLKSRIYLYIFVEPFLSVQKLLPQRSCDQRETQDYYSPRHGACPRKAPHGFPLWRKMTPFFVGLQMVNTRFRIIVTLQRAKRQLRYLASGTADSTANTRVGKEHQKHRAVHNVYIGHPSPTV